jgi:DNA-directed RNA polymerase subunit beta
MVVFVQLRHQKDRTWVFASLTTCARVNKSGFLETPFWRVINGKVINRSTTLFNCGYRGLYKIAPADIATNKENYLIKNVIRSL